MGTDGPRRALGACFLAACSLAACQGAPVAPAGPASGPGAEVADSLVAGVSELAPDVLVPPFRNEARLRIQVAFPARRVQIIPAGTAEVTLTLSGGTLTQPIVTTMTPPPPPQVDAQRTFLGLRQGQGFTLLAEAKNASGTVLAKGRKSDLALFSGSNSVGLEMSLAGTSGKLDF